MKKKLFAVVGIIVLVMVVGYIALTVYANTAQQPKVAQMPPVDKAKYEFYIANTGTKILTNSYDTKGTVYTLHNYYEFTAAHQWVFRKQELPLDRKTFGQITITTRTK